MIDKSKYMEARKIVEEYKREVNIAVTREKICICCKQNKIRPDFEMSDNTNARNQDDLCWDNGTVFRMNPGFGSRYDTESFFAAVCDDCMRELIDKQLIEHVTNIEIFYNNMTR